MKNNAKRIICSALSIAAICTGALGLTGCNNDNNSTMKHVALCKPSKASGNDEYLELILGKDNKTIEQATIRRYTTLDTLKSKVQSTGYSVIKTNDGNTLDAEKDTTEFYNTLYGTTIEDYETLYYMYTSKNTKYSWLSYTLNENDTDKTAELIISFDFTDKSFKFDDKTIKFLQSSLPFNQLYNEDEQRLEYKDGQIDKLYKKAGLDNTCTVSTKDQSKTYHHKAVVQLKKAKSKAKELNNK